MLNEYIKYLKNNPKGYWFKKRLFGWGWAPARWQGFALMGIYLLILLFYGMSFSKNTNPTDTQLAQFFATIILLIASLILICYKTGEKPRWQWGFPDK